MATGTKHRRSGIKKKQQVAEAWLRPDGIPIHYQVLPAAKSKGVVVILHGLGEHSERYADFAGFLVKHGWTVYLYDQRGHGRSGGARMHAQSIAELADDLRDFLKFARKQGGDSPFFLIAHSFGGQVAINCLAQNGIQVDGAVLSAPNVQVAVKVPPLKRSAAKLLSYILPTFSVANEIDPDTVSRDKDIVAKYKADPLVQHQISVRLGTQILENVDAIFEIIPKIKVPLLILHGSEDRITSPAGSRKLYESVGSKDKRFKLYPGFYHEILNEIGKHEVYQDIETWLEEHV